MACSFLVECCKPIMWLNNSFVLDKSFVPKVTYKDRYLFVVDLLFIRKIKHTDWLNILYVLKCN